MDRQRALFEPSQLSTKTSWTPPESLPQIRGRFKRIGFDKETTGKNKFTDSSVGTAISTPDGKRYYLPTGHRGGGNLDRGLVRRWAQAELRDIELVGLNIGFDSEMSLGEGVDLEAQGCTLRDVGHSAALLNEQRYAGFSLNDLGIEYVGRGKKELTVPPEDIHKVHSSLVGPYAEEDAALALDIAEKQDPMLEAEDLMKVQQLENELIWANNHMERNGARIDRPKLERWVEESKQRYGDLILDIWRATKIRVNPNSPDDLSKLFKHLGIRNDNLTAGGDESFTKEILSKIDDPVVKMALKARQINSIKSKYLDKYLKRLDSNNILRFKLYQLRAGEEDFGTITGRYSSADINIQQVFKVENQIEQFGDEYIVRELFIPDEGFDFFSGDASQIEFRLFAHYSGSRRLIDAYRNNPKMDFHQLVADMLNQIRNHAKHNNFGKLYGMGLRKLARRLGMPCTCGCPDKFAWDETRHAAGCPMIKAIAIAHEYDSQFPEARRLMNTAMRLAEQRGYVRTLLGRRRRYPTRENLHSALNAVIQGSAADVFKLKVIQLYRNMKTIGIHKMRFPVHDEETGDVEKSETAHRRLREFFNDSVYPLEVPVLWDVEIGSDWRACA